MKNIFRLVSVFMILLTITNCATLNGVTRGKSEEAHQKAPGQQKK